jgi:DNA polymerase alpha subunit B
MTVVGRITLDSESSSSGSVKLNEASLALESSRMMGSGARVPLRFDPSFKVRGGAKGASGLGLFPGAIVALRGKNGGAGWFLVSEILVVSSLSIALPSIA